jgi:hypothetical protein
MFLAGIESQDQSQSGGGDVGVEARGSSVGEDFKVTLGLWECGLEKVSAEAMLNQCRHG